MYVSEIPHFHKLCMLKRGATIDIYARPSAPAPATSAKTFNSLYIPNILLDSCFNDSISRTAPNC